MHVPHALAKKDQGFTLIELLIVIAIIAILAAVTFVALDPLRRFRDARDARRWADIDGIISAVKLNQVDNNGTLLAAVTAAPTGANRLIGTNAGDCSTITPCDVTLNASCMSLAGLVTSGHIAAVPISPNGAGTWTSTNTGYYLNYNATSGAITVGACESENTSAINVTR